MSSDSNDPANLICPLILDLFDDPITVPCCGQAVSRLPLKHHFVHQQQQHQNLYEDEDDEDKPVQNCPLCRTNLAGDPHHFNVDIAQSSRNLAQMVEEELQKRQRQKQSNNNGSLSSSSSSSSSKDAPLWRAKLHLLSTHPLHPQYSKSTRIAKLNIVPVGNWKPSFQTLIVPVVDMSGSMAGAPNRQVVYSMLRFVDLIYQHRDLLAYCITYCDQARLFPLNAQNPNEKKACEQFANGLRASGGTIFSAAFEQMVNVLKQHNANPHISSAVFLFLTDGEDGSGVPRPTLCAQLRKQIQESWTGGKDVVIHTVGFGSGFDANFLRDLSTCGTKPGVNKFADPNENDDMLSMKINGILNVVATALQVPMQFVQMVRRSEEKEQMQTPPEENKQEEFKQQQQQSEEEVKDQQQQQQVRPLLFRVPRVISVPNPQETIFWLDCTDAFHLNELSIQLQINKQPQISEMECEVQEDENQPEIWSDWVSILIDELTTELIGIVPYEGEDGAIPNQLRLLLLEERAKVLSEKLLQNSFGAGAISSESLELHQNRLHQFNIQLQAAKLGAGVDMLRLRDLQSEGVFSSTASGSSSSSSIHNRVAGVKPVKQMDHAVPHRMMGGGAQSTKSNRSSYWYQYIAKPYDVEEGKRRVFARKRDPSELAPFAKIVSLNNQQLMDYFNAYDWSNHAAACMMDPNGNNFLRASACIGRVLAVQTLVQKSTQGGYFDATHCNPKNGFNALDFSIIYGFWKCFDILQPLMKPTINPRHALCTALRNRHTETAKRLVEHYLMDEIAVLAKELIEDAPSSLAANWLQFYTNCDIPIHTAIAQGMILNVERYIKENSHLEIKEESKESSEPNSKSQYPLSLAQCSVSLFREPTAEHLQVLKMLYDSKMADPWEMFDSTNSKNETYTVFPLFLACDRKHEALFELLLRYIPSHDSPEYVNKRVLSKDCKQNADEQEDKENDKKEEQEPGKVGTIPQQKIRPGATALWISACNDQMNMVSTLINLGADVNITNELGDSPLIPCCQKGQNVMLQVLLAAGAEIHVHNPERDNPILLCCRVGNHEGLQFLLQSVTDVQERNKWLQKSNPIDGFCPLIAAAELDKVECLNVLHSFGADLEARTDPDNQILPGATAIHVACYYGRVKAVQSLIQLGADCLSVTSVDQFSCLHLAIRQNHYALVEYLMSISRLREHNLKQMDSFGRTPEFYAKMAGHESIHERWFDSVLARCLEKVLFVCHDVMEKRVCEVILKHGCSKGVFDFDRLFCIHLSDGYTVASRIFLLRRRHLYQCMVTALGLNNHLNNNNSHVTHPSILALSDDPLFPDISPAFWQAVLSDDFAVQCSSKTATAISSSSGACSSSISPLIERVIKSKKSGFQNRFFLTLGSLPKLKNLVETEQFLLTRVQQDRLCKFAEQAPAAEQKNLCSFNALTPVKNSQNQSNLLSSSSLRKLLNMEEKGQVQHSQAQSKQKEISLLAFLNMSAKELGHPSLNKNTLSRLFVDAVAHVIKLVASGEEILQPHHLFALYLFTCSVSIQEWIGEQLTIKQSFHAASWQLFSQCLYQALSLLPPLRSENSLGQEIYYAVDSPFVLEEFRIGNVLEWNSLSLCSTQWSRASDLIECNRGMVFLIQPKKQKVKELNESKSNNHEICSSVFPSVRSVSRYSANPLNSEVMILPGTQFRITNYYKASCTALAQPNIRNTTFKVEPLETALSNEKYLEKVLKKKICILIELQEM